MEVINIRAYYCGTSKDGNGKVVCSATISVYLAGSSTAASIYTTLAGATAVNSVTSGAETSSTSGFFEFYVSRFDYDISQKFKIVISKSGFTSQTYDYIEIDQIVLGNYSIAAAKTITTNIIIPKGVVFVHSTGGSMAFSGVCEIGHYQVFSGFDDGDVTFAATSITEAYPEWFGETQSDYSATTASVTDSDIPVVITHPLAALKLSISGTTYTVSVGIDDSGGAGYRLLRITN